MKLLHNQVWKMLKVEVQASRLSNTEKKLEQNQVWKVLKEEVQAS